MTITGLIRGFERLFEPWTVSGNALHGTVAGCALLSIASGVRFPQRIALWLCTQAWRRFVLRGQVTEASPLLLGSHGPDRQLYWIVLSVVALVAGVAVAALPLALRGAGAVHLWMHNHFLWSIGPLAILQATIILLTLLIPLALIGLAVSCLHRLCCSHGRWATRATGEIVIGAGAGVALAALIQTAAGQADLMMASAALPALIVALLAAVSASPRASDLIEESGRGEEAPPLPVFRDTRPRLLRTAIVAVGGAGAGALAVWHAVGATGMGEWDTAISGTAHGTAGPLSATAMFTATGIGVLIGCRNFAREELSISRFGAACIGSGVILSAGAALAVGAGDVRLAASGTYNRVLLLAACLGLGIIGCTLSCGRRVLLSRVANRASEGARILSRTLTVAALMVWLVAPLSVRMIGAAPTLLVTAMFFIILGALLILRVRERSS